MKSEESLLQLRSLKREVRKLSVKSEAVRIVSLKDPCSVENLLKARGLQIFRKDPSDHLLIPPDVSSLHRSKLFDRMKKYSFRLVLRDMIKRQTRFRVDDLTHYCSREVAQDYIDFLLRMGIVEKLRNERYRTRVSPLYSFGPTLEWFISEMFKKDLASPALYGVSIRDTPGGGDYDVVASWNRRLVYVEVKSSPPRGIEQSEISAFFSRIDDLLPEVAILFNDTQLRMKDKLVLMFEEELKRRHGKKSKTAYRVERLVDELFHVRNRVFIINSRKDVFQNFSVCLRHYLRQAMTD